MLDGKCYSIGRNPNGQLGLEGVDKALFPKLIVGLEKHKIVKVLFSLFLLLRINSRFLL
jgi:hypothetical protein